MNYILGVAITLPVPTQARFQQSLDATVHIILIYVKIHYDRQ